VLAGEQLSVRRSQNAQSVIHKKHQKIPSQVVDGFLRLTKEEGSDYAEPSQEGPVGSTTGNRPLNNQFPVNLR